MDTFHPSSGHSLQLVSTETGHEGDKIGFTVKALLCHQKLEVKLRIPRLLLHLLITQERVRQTHNMSRNGRYKVIDFLGRMDED